MTISSVINPVIRPVINPVIGDGGFTPRQLANLAVWLRSKSILQANETLVSSWTNEGNMGVGNATQGTALRQPLYVASAINGRPAVRGRHDGVNASQLAIVDSAGLKYTNFTAYIVNTREVDTGVEELLFGKWDSATNKREHQLTITSGDGLQGTVSSNGTSAAAAVAGLVTQTTGVPRIIRFQYNGSQLQLQTLGATQQTVSFSGSIFQSDIAYTLFSRTGFLIPYAGLIAELLFFTSSLSANELILIENYLRIEYGIA